MTDRPADYRTAGEVDAWCEGILDRAERAELTVDRLEDETYPFRIGVRHTPAQYVRFSSPELGEWFGIWQPCPSGRGPVLVHVPGYGAEMSTHPELVADGFNVLHVNPQGYATPVGADESKRDGDAWPVLPETIRSCGERGYVDWLAQAAAATLWALGLPAVGEGRLAFFGTSQGGGGALLLSSIFSGRGARACAADVAFLTGFAIAAAKDNPGAYGLALAPLRELAEKNPGSAANARRAIGFIDTLSHAHRLTMPVLLTAGLEDEACPVDQIRALFEELPGTRSFTELAGQAHAYTQPFLHLARAWFRLYV
jgi:cephalosporin-C deacetylase-like acetyl esterase